MPFLQWSKFSSPVLFSKYTTARDGLSDGSREGACLDQGCHITTAIITTATKAKAGTKSFFNPSVTVISFEVRGFLSGITLSVVGIPLSIFSSSERNSPALWYLLSFSFSKHIRIIRLRSSEI